jgi:hypothetical protein
MKITFWKGVFVADHAPGEEERLLKRAGFVLHEPTLCEPAICRGCRARIGRRYWSDRVEHATRLRSYCLPRALEVMKNHLGKLAASRAVDAKISVPAPAGLSYKPYQRAGIAYAVARKDTLFGDDMGLGKALTLCAKILTPTGWTTMGEIEVGSPVIGSNGQIYHVTGTYPQGQHQVYRVTFQDGGSAKCDLRHLWEVNTPRRIALGLPPRVLSLLDILREKIVDDVGNWQHLVRRVNADLPAHLRSPKEYPLYRAIVEIEPVDRQQTKCIRVDSPDNLYIINDYILTHNTVEALGVANIIRPRNILVVAPATLALNWKIEAERWLVRPYRYFIPDDGSDEVPREDQGLCVITNYEKIAGLTPRRQRVPLAAIEGDIIASSQFSFASVEKMTLVAESAKKNNTPVLCQSPTRPDRFRAISNSVVVEAARILGWPRLTAIVLPPGISTLGLDLKKIMKTVQHTPLSRSLRRPWELAIFDEAQALKNPESQRSRAVLGKDGLYHHSHRSLFLSGTPLENYPIEIWPMAAAICPAKFGDWQKFAHRYCGLHTEARAGKNVWVYNGCTNHSELQQRLRTSFMIRRLKTDVMKELPPKRRQLVVLDEKIDWSRYPEFQRWRELYERAYDEALARMEAAKTQVEYLSAARALETVTVPFTESSDMRHKTALLKLPACLRHADELLSSGLDCLVIYAHHRDVLEEIHEHYGDQSCVIYGDTQMEERIPIVQAFQEGRKKIFVGGLKAAGTGITLTRASVVDFFETDWNPATMKQCEDRLWRYGQKKMVHVFHPVLNGSLDANMVQKMLSKQEAVDRVLDHLPEQTTIPRKSQTTRT